MWTWNLQIKVPSLARKPFADLLTDASINLTFLRFARIASLDPLAVNK
jgi:hypothetical protein